MHPAGVLHCVENADDPDIIPAGKTTLVMATMATLRQEALWLPGTQLFIHAANHADQLRGCVAPGLLATEDGVRSSRAAMLELFDSLGGFREGETVETRVVEVCL